jgi:aryl-alcohol dehydrogenase-like predicted oxidoreductase
LKKPEIFTIGGAPASTLGLAAYPKQSPGCVGRAFESGVNFFFFYDLGYTAFLQQLKSVARRQRDEVIIASGSGSRTPRGLQAVRRKILSAVGTDMIDVFFAEYIHPGDNVAAVFGRGGVLDELQQWKAKGWIRFVGASAHDRLLAGKLAIDDRVDVLMHRFNMAHRKAEAEVFPAALEARTPVVAFTATRWGSLLKPHPRWPGEPPTAADCYRYCLAQPAVRVVLTAPTTTTELNQNLSVLQSPPITSKARDRWDQFGDLIYNEGHGKNHEFESQWP